MLRHYKERSGRAGRALPAVYDHCAVLHHPFYIVENYVDVGEGIAFNCD